MKRRVAFWVVAFVACVGVFVAYEHCSKEVGGCLLGVMFGYIANDIYLSLNIGKKKAES
jgi:hypothetical protein